MKWWVAFKKRDFLAIERGFSFEPSRIWMMERVGIQHRLLAALKHRP
jgi:hypothetical protein